MTAIHCPVCRGPFQESVREGILIDTCTQCRGIWLDCGELEKLLAAICQKVVNASNAQHDGMAAQSKGHTSPPQQSHYSPPQHPHQGLPIALSPGL